VSSRTARRALVIGLVALAALHFAGLGQRLVWLSGIDGWFWGITNRPTWSPWVVLAFMIAMVSTVALATWAEPRRGWPRALALVLVAYAMQHIAAFSEGRGLAGLRDRIVTTGHAEFVTVAVRERATPDLLRTYNARAEAGALGQYAPSKPPGQLQLYMATDFVSRRFATAPTPEAEADALRDVATWWWPLFAALPVLPIYALGVLLSRRQGARGEDRGAALTAAALYAVVPAVALITLHTDQVFYPLLVACAALAAFAASRHPRAAVSLLAGLAYAAALYCSFGLLAAAPVIATLVVGAEPLSDRAGWRRALSRLALWALGLAIAYAILRFGFGYDWLDGRRIAQAHHVKWKGWDERQATFVHYGMLDVLDFAVWVGLPVALVALLAFIGALADLRASLRAASPRLALGLLACFVGLVMMGRTKGETGRLWLFLAPFVCLTAAAWLHRRLRARPQEIAVLIALQATSIYFMKRFMDFW